MELIDLFEIRTPPVPVETMLQKPQTKLWKDVNVSQLTGSFLTFKEEFSPRMSMARLLARHIINCDWGQERKLVSLVGSDEESLRTFARMLIMPIEFVKALPTAARNPTEISAIFEVPREDAQRRLLELD